MRCRRAHALRHLNVDESFIVDYFLEVTLLDDGLRDERQVQSCTLFSGWDVVEVEILDVEAHELSILCGNDAIQEDLGCDEVRCFGLHGSGVTHPWKNLNTCGSKCKTFRRTSCAAAISIPKFTMGACVLKSARACPVFPKVAI